MFLFWLYCYVLIVLCAGGMWRGPETRRHKRSCNSIEMNSMHKRNSGLLGSYTLERHYRLCTDMYKSLSYIACKDSTYMLRNCVDESSHSSPSSVRDCVAYPWSRWVGGTDRARFQVPLWLESRVSTYISRWNDRAFEVQSQRFSLTVPSDYIRWY